MPRVIRDRPQPWPEARKGVRRRWLVPYFWLEWIWDWTAHALSGWIFLEVLEYVGKFSVLVAVITYFVEAPDRQKQKHYQAWQVINTAQGKGGSGGRIEAMEELNRDHEPLVGVNAAGAYLGGVRLDKARLIRAELEATDMRDCHLRGAMLEDSGLRSANLRGGDLTNADLSRADLTDADLAGANLQKATLDGVNLDNADLRECDLRDVRWKSIASIKLANLFHARNVPAGFQEWAMKNGAVLIESDGEWLKLIAANSTVAGKSPE